MMIQELAKKYCENMYSLPLNEADLVDFAKLILSEFTKELERNKTTVTWNYGCDSVIFYRKDFEKKSLMTIKEDWDVD